MHLTASIFSGGEHVTRIPQGCNIVSAGSSTKVRITDVMRVAHEIKHFYRTLILTELIAIKKQRLKKIISRQVEYI